MRIQYGKLRKATVMIQLVLDLLYLLTSGAQIIPLPGTPVAIQPVNRGFAVACIDPSVVCVVDTNSEIDVLLLELDEPRDLSVWDTELVVSDFGGRSVVTGNRVIPVPGNPDGMCEVFWNSSSHSELAVALFDPGIVVLVNQDGSSSTLVEFTGVKCLSPCDADGDGDMDIFASGCGGGIIFIENASSLPIAHQVGIIQVGVKRCCAVDMDGDGFMDVAGIACAEGGAGWWRNPGNPAGRWVYHEIDGSLKGPKGISCSGDSLVIASLFSDVIFSFDSSFHLPGGFTCCHISHEGDVVLGHRLGFLVTVSGNGGFL